MGRAPKACELSAGPRREDFLAAAYSIDFSPLPNTVRTVADPYRPYATLVGAANGGRDWPRPSALPTTAPTPTTAPASISPTPNATFPQGLEAGSTPTLARSPASATETDSIRIHSNLKKLHCYLIYKASWLRIRSCDTTASGSKYYHNFTLSVLELSDAAISCFTSPIL